MKTTFKINDFPMHCCGLVTAEDFLYKEIVQNDGNYRYSTTYERREHIRKMFPLIEEHQKKYKRNCAMITLSDSQHIARELAEQEFGYTKIYSFWNANTEHNVHVYVKTLWENSAAYEKAVADGYKPTATGSYWANSAGVIEHEV